MDFKSLFAGLASVLLASLCSAHFEFICPSTIGLFPNIRNSECTTFWRCIPTLAIRETCPTGEKFDFIIRKCVTELTQLQCDDQRGAFLQDISVQTNNGGGPQTNGNQQHNNDDCLGNKEAVTDGTGELNPMTPSVDPTAPIQTENTLPASHDQITEIQGLPNEPAPVLPAQPVAAIPQQPLYYAYGYPSYYMYYRFVRRYGRSIRDPPDNSVLFDLPEGIKIPTRECTYIENVLNQTLRQLVTSITGNDPCSRENCLLPGIRIRCQSNL